MNDNLGRRRALVIALFISSLGIVIIASSINLVITMVGLFLAGFGIDPAINSTLYFITETVDNHVRHKHSILIQFFLSLAGVANILYYLIFQDWRIIYWLFFFLPAAVFLLFAYWFVQETPQFSIMLYSS